LDYNLNLAVTNATKSSFESNASSFTQLEEEFTQRNKKMEKASTQALIWGAVIVVVVIAIVFGIYKFYKKPEPTQPQFVGPQPQPVGPQPQFVGQPLQQSRFTHNLSKVMPPRTQAYYSMMKTK
jgi:flagellar basal body-associated protein FliL